MSVVPFAPTDAEVFQLMYLLARMHEQTGIHLGGVANLAHLLGESPGPEQSKQLLDLLRGETERAEAAHLESFNLVRKIIASRRNPTTVV